MPVAHVLSLTNYADKFGLPIITLVDTPGAYAGKAAEELGQVRLLLTSVVLVPVSAALPVPAFVFVSCLDTNVSHSVTSATSSMFCILRWTALLVCLIGYPLQRHNAQLPCAHLVCTGRGHCVQPEGNVWAASACHQPGHWGGGLRCGTGRLSASFMARK